LGARCSIAVALQALQAIVCDERPLTGLTNAGELTYEVDVRTLSDARPLFALWRWMAVS